MLTLWESPAVVGLIVGAPMAVVAFLGWWRTRGMDADAKDAAEETYQVARVKQVVDGLDNIIERVEGELRRAYERIERQDQRIERLEREIRELRAEKGNGKP